MQDALIYVHDPMCSWCWGFEPTRRKLFESLNDRLPIRRMLGGLAPDSDQPMPMPMRKMLQQTWQRIAETIPGTQFNFEFWEKCAPRRSTYPANRAVLAARAQGEDHDERMTSRIQRAYYLEARNPSDDETLIALATEIGLDQDEFSRTLASPASQQLLLEEIQQCRNIGIDSFPSVAVYKDGVLHPIGLNYLDADAMLQQIEAL